MRRGAISCLLVVVASAGSNAEEPGLYPTVHGRQWGLHGPRRQGGRGSSVRPRAPAARGAPASRRTASRAFSTRPAASGGTFADGGYFERTGRRSPPRCRNEPCCLSRVGSGTARRTAVGDPAQASRASAARLRQAPVRLAGWLHAPCRHARRRPRPRRPRGAALRRGAGGSQPVAIAHRALCRARLSRARVAPEAEAQPLPAVGRAAGAQPPAATPGVRTGC